MLAPFMDDIRDHDVIAPKRMAQRLCVTMSHLARIAHLNRNTMSARPNSPAVQNKLAQIALIIARASELCTDEGAAVIWFKYQTIRGFGKTAEQLVEEGHADLVLEDLARQAAGVFS